MNVDLKGSVTVIVEFFEFAIYCILYQRQIYSSEHFEFVKKYHTTCVVSKDDSITRYVQQLLHQAKIWLEKGSISALVLVVLDMDQCVKERWHFHIEYQSIDKQDDISKQLSAIIKQITCCVGFLPILQENVTFNVLAYTSKNDLIPTDWIDSDAKLIQNPELVTLRELDTGYHKIGGMVQYHVG